ncbi:hypothetical protein [Nocardia sp. alder85J]|nr:hypothetical protein [Nocardia sp. alder85J]MCX4090784.1 hypothetical protein [Nocardia sp. alder85J]
MANALEHEFLHLFRGNPDLAARLLRDYLGIAIPEYTWCSWNVAACL